MQILAMFFNFIRGLVFENKDECNFKSPKFNIKKVFVLVLLVLSIVLNFFVSAAFIRLGNRYIELKEENLKIKKELVQTKASKFNEQTPSDSQKP